MVYQINYQNHVKNEIVLTDLRQCLVHDRFNNIEDAKKLLVRYLKKSIEIGNFSIEEKNQVKKRIVEINKITKKDILK